MEKEASQGKSYDIIEELSDGKNYWEMPDRTAISFILDDKPGSLIGALAVFIQNGVNLTRISSKPPSKNSEP